ncbi:MAG: hypothetical protein A2Y40_09160 [Candidatus Margulisbacteria bacterium GWF2_35_9]|nr:MAG: hypothetical protein A2Y40_09160 [Candidatus Margulisbacteria bacterium GWF2_35_9]
MNDKTKKYLYDIINSAKEIDQYTQNFSLKDYLNNKLIQRAVERNFEIIGEALNKIKFIDDEILQSISEHHKIIAFRNILIHGYTDIDEKMVWSAVVKHLPLLRLEINKLLML